MHRIHKAISFWLWLMVLMVGIGGCAGPSSEVINEATTPPGDFILGPEDVIEVTVWRTPDLSGEAVIRPDGMISMPLIGDIQARGLTADQLAERIQKQLQKFKENPEVTVSVKAVNSYNIYVLGEVNNPGRIQLKSHTTVLQAIALAGGFTTFASRNSIQVIRIIQNGDSPRREMRIPVAYDEVVDGDGEVGNFVLKPGDTLVVP